MKRPLLELVLASGFFAVAFAIALARLQPATAYEVSIYTGTPVWSWIGLAVGLAIAVGVALACRGPYQIAGIGLGSLAVTVIVGLPVIRNYRFAGMGDALSHLGWARDLSNGEMYANDLFYPAVHSVATAIHTLAGVPLERAMLMVVVLFFVPFLVFVPLIVREISGDAFAVGIAAVVSWMVLPINNVATHMGIHTNSNALFFVPVILFALVAYLNRGGESQRLPFGISPYSLLVYVTGIGLLLIHPQHMIHFVVLVGAISAIQVLGSWRSLDHPILDHPATYMHTAVLGSLVVLWTLSNARFRDALSGLLYGIFTQDIGAGAEVGQREDSLADIGGSLAELFVKMFLEAALIGLLIGLFLLVLWMGLDQDRLTPETRVFSNYFSIALFPLGAMLVLYAVGTPTMAFRQIGFIYVLLTVLAGVALSYWFGGLATVITTPGAKAVASVFLGICLVLALLTVYSSPVIYDPGQHVTDEQLNGHATTLEHADTDWPYVGYGYNPFRYDHALNGIEGTDSLGGGTVDSGSVNPEAFERGDYAEAYGGLSYYLTVTVYDETREHDVYNELHHSEQALEELEYDSNVNKVVSNDEFRAYTVSGA